MNQGKYIFSQIVEFLPRYEFDKLVGKYSGQKGVRNFSCRDQFLALMFGQLTNLKSLRGIVVSLNAHARQLYHLGFRTNKFILSTITRANERRDWKIYRDLARLLISKARELYVNDIELDINLKGTPYILDSTVIELCLSMFRWAKFERTTAAVKIHTQLDLLANIPSFFRITTAKVADVNFMDDIEIEEKAYYIMDRGYYDFGRLHKIHSQKAWFVIRSRKDLSFTRLYSRKVDKTIGLRCDQVIKFRRFYGKKVYPEKLRRIKYHDQEKDKYYTYLTNNFDLKAIDIAELYKQRWKIELFFKWIKQHLHINVFWGCSFNAVKTQICIAISTFLLVAIMKKQMKINRNLHEILQILSVTQFERTPLNTLISKSSLQIFNEQDDKQRRLVGI